MVSHSFIGLQPSNFRTLSERASPGIISVGLLEQIQFNVFSEVQFATVQFQLLPYNFYLEKEKERRGKTVRKFVLFAVQC